LDENLSPKLSDRLRPIFPEIQHVDLAGLRGQVDHAIWDFARDHGLAIVSKDNDFRQLAFLYGPPPKVIWLAVGNAGTVAIGRLLEEQADAIHSFLAARDEALLVLELEGPGA
jgi:predicted nuclease of predicted toxin-antitoxin system